MYSNELTTEVIHKFLMMLPPFKDNYTTVHETKFVDSLPIYTLENTDFDFFIEGDYNPNEKCFLKMEDNDSDNHWCFITEVKCLGNMYD